MTNQGRNTIEQQADEFYRWLGLCITSWAHVEDQLFHYCWAILGGSKQRAAIVFFRTPTLETRVALIDELLPTILPAIPKNGHKGPYAIKTWSEIKADYSVLIPIRNKLAHNQALPNVAWGDRLAAAPKSAKPITEDGLKLSWYEVYESHAKIARGDKDPGAPITLDDLKEHQRGVAGLTAKLIIFYQDHVLKHAPESVLTRALQTQG